MRALFAPLPHPSAVVSVLAHMREWLTRHDCITGCSNPGLDAANTAARRRWKYPRHPLAKGVAIAAATCPYQHPHLPSLKTEGASKIFSGLSGGFGTLAAGFSTKGFHSKGVFVMLKRVLLLPLILLGWALSLDGAVAESFTCVTCSADSGDTAQASASFTNFTVDSGSNLCLIGILHLRTAVTNPSMTWNGVAMTQIGSGIQGTNAGVRMFYLVNPATGNQTLAASWTTNSVWALGAVAFSGADQTTCVDAAHTVTATGSSTEASTGAITSTTDGATVGAATNAGSANFTAQNQTLVYFENSQTFQEGAASYAIGGTSNTHTFTMGSTTWAAMGVHVKAAATGSGGIIGGGGGIIGQ